MEELGMKKQQNFWKNKRVLVTGHTGFKGSWLILILLHLGVEVCGYSTNSSQRKSIFKLNEKILSKKIHHIVGDIRDSESLNKTISFFKPDIIFHLAAQPLVLTSIKYPIETWQTNLMGTNILLESTKSLNKHCAVIIITTDKVYENKGISYAFKETDRLGGNDPYSASKSCVEQACKSWHHTYIRNASSFKINNVSLATGRAGNVIGGGDWSENRLIPDCIKSSDNNLILNIRNPSATRPWQHVLDCLHGYLLLAEHKYASDPDSFDSFNFGPPNSSNKTVLQVIEEVSKSLPYLKYELNEQNSQQESRILQLDSSKALQVLNWQNLLKFENAILETITWYKNCRGPIESYEITVEQIKEFFSSI